MVNYNFRGKDASGESVRGVLEAESIADALHRLRERGLTDLYVGLAISPEEEGTTGNAAMSEPPRTSAAQKTTAAGASPSTRTHSLDWRQLAELNEQLLGLVRAGLPLAPSIAAMARYMSGRQGRAVAETLQRDIASGMSLAEALDRQPAAFPPLCRAMMRAGEASGSVEQVFVCLTDYSRAMAETRSRVIETITYPLVLIAAAFLLTLFMLIKVVPVFQGVLYADLMLYSEPASIIFKGWVALSNFADKHLSAILIGFALLFGGLIWLCVPRPGGRMRWLWADALRLRMPLFGRLNTMGAMSQFCRALGMLVETRTPLPEALALASAASGNLAVEAAGMRAVTRIQAGAELGEALMQAGRFDASLCWLVQNGEHQNSLAETLHTLAGTYESNADRHRRWVLMLLGPVVTVIIGLFVGFMFFSVYGPLMTGMLG